MFKIKLTKQEEGSFDKMLVVFRSDGVTREIIWFPFVKAYKTRYLHKSDPESQYLTHNTIINLLSGEKPLLRFLK